MKIVELTDAAATHEAAVLFDGIWRSGDHVLDPNTMRALAHTGNYLAGAYDGDELVGASVGFFAADGHLHSHVTGVAPSHQGRGVGRALKQHQREWALARGRDTISWTFDPLVARNAYFNLHTLGAVAVEYLPDFYGAMDDGVNAGDASDRLYVVWPLRESARPAPDVRTARRITIAMPPDIERLRVTDRELAVRWRMEVRAAMMDALGRGYRITGITRDGSYLLEANT